MRVTLIDHLTLDGVMQAPGRADEDPRGGFAHGGWATPYTDAVQMQVMGRGMAAGLSGEGGLLLGRRTYEDFFKVWPARTDNPFTPVLNAARKYVASTTLAEPLPWQNSILLPGDAADAVAAMKASGGPDLTILGSGALARSLMRRGLIDDFLFTIHPLVMGAGGRLFSQDLPLTRLSLVDATPTTTGVIIARYRLAEAP
jgi:dihydrofolate reductase